MILSNLLTIVIPCKNEGNIINLSLDLLNHQENIQNVNVIICDSSDDNITRLLLDNRKNDLFNLKIVDGGLPSVARNIGAKLSNTPYILFIDSDIFILDTSNFLNSLENVINNNIDLLTCKFRTTTGEYNYVYKVFDIIQLLVKPITPFSLGGYMLIKNKKFIELGGFDEKVKVAEDYVLSKQIKPSKFKISDSIIYTTPRRFKTKGLLYMLKLMIGSFLNQNNKKYFEDDKNYWS